jgi:hypothetical protein
LFTLNLLSLACHGESLFYYCKSISKKKRLGSSRTRNFSFAGTFYYCLKSHCGAAAAVGGGEEEAAKLKRNKKTHETVSEPLISHGEVRRKTLRGGEEAPKSIGNIKP